MHKLLHEKRNWNLQRWEDQVYLHLSKGRLALWLYCRTRFRFRLRWLWHWLWLWLWHWLWHWLGWCWRRGGSCCLRFRNHGNLAHRQPNYCLHLHLRVLLLLQQNLLLRAKTRAYYNCCATARAKALDATSDAALDATLDDGSSSRSYGNDGPTTNDGWLWRTNGGSQPHVQFHNHNNLDHARWRYDDAAWIDVLNQVPGTINL